MKEYEVTQREIAADRIATAAAGRGSSPAADSFPRDAWPHCVFFDGTNLTGTLATTIMATSQLAYPASCRSLQNIGGNGTSMRLLDTPR